MKKVMKGIAKHSYIYGVVIILAYCTGSYAQKKLAGNRIVTEWRTQIGVNNVLL